MTALIFSKCEGRSKASGKQKPDHHRFRRVSNKSNLGLCYMRRVLRVLIRAYRQGLFGDRAYTIALKAPNFIGFS